MENIPPLPPPPPNASTAKAVPRIPYRSHVEVYPPRPPSPSSKPQRTQTMPNQPAPRASRTLLSERPLERAAAVKDNSANHRPVARPQTPPFASTERCPSSAGSHMRRQSVQLSTQVHENGAAPLAEGDGSLLHNMHRPPPGDSFQNVPRTHQKSELNPIKQRSAHLEDVFGGSRKSSIEAAEHACGESKIIVEFKTNVLVHDEWTLCYELIRELAHRYSRSPDSVLVTIQHSVCILFQSTFEPTYLITISVPPPELTPSVTRHNAAVIQKLMHETLGVHASRGVVQFLAVPIDCLVWNGMTGVAPALGPCNGAIKAEDLAKAKRRLSVRSLSGLRSRAQTPTPTVPDVPPRCNQGGLSRTEAPSIAPGHASVDLGNGTGRDKPLPRTLKQKRSFVTNLFARRAGSRQDIDLQKENIPVSSTWQGD